MTDVDAIARALTTDMTIDIVTTGRRSGQPRTTEIWFMNLDGRIIICGTLGSITTNRRYSPRDWLANLKATPEFVFRFKESIDAEVPARACEVTDPQDRRWIFSHDATDWYRRQEDTLDTLVEFGPVVEVWFDEPFDHLTPAPRPT